MIRKLALTSAAVLGLSACGEDATTQIDQQGASCDGNVCTLSGTLTEDLTLTADKQWILSGGVFVGNDVDRTILTIEPGTTIFGESSTRGMLVVTRGSQIIADGTAAAPIVFTSAKTDGNRGRGDWGGLVINGRAPVNGCDTAPCEGFGEGGTGFFGGDDANDNSGILRYVRVEFGGNLISTDNEMNGIAFQGVGAGTTVDFIQVHMNKDDGIEFFGGTVDIKHVLLTGIADDSLDWTDGWRGRGQYIIAQQTGEHHDNGIEADNNGEVNDALPRSAPMLSNITLVGSSTNQGSDLGMLLREGTAAEIYNTVVVGFNEACLDIDDAATFAQVQAGDLLIQNSMMQCDINYDESNDDPFTVQSFFEDAAASNTLAAPMLTSTAEVAPDFRPQAASPAANGAAALNDTFFDTVNFIGGMSPTEDWTAGWTTDAAN